MTATRSRPNRRLDPRLQARRRNVARSQGRRRLWTVFGVTLVATLAIGAIGLNNSRWLDVDDVVIVGAERADQRHIVTASGLMFGDPLAEISTTAVVGSVESVPWVATAQVKRGWGGVVTITVIERVGVAAVPAGGRFAIVDVEGHLLEVVPTRPEGFLPIDGIDVSGVPGQMIDPPGLAAVTVVDQLTPALADQAERIMVEEDQVFLLLNIGGRANLGDSGQLGPKMVALETVLAQVDLTCIDTIDVRVPTSPTVRRLPGAAAKQETLADTGGC